QQMHAKYARAVPDLKAYMVYVLNRVTMPGAPAFDTAAALDELWSARARMTVSGRALLLLTLDARKGGRTNWRATWPAKPRPAVTCPGGPWNRIRSSTTS